MIRKMFMVDDDAGDQEIFREVMEGIDSDIEITFSSNGVEVLEQIVSKGRPDVIFLDCMMPVMDGIECLTKLKANRSTKQIPVVMYTASENHSENELAIRLGAFQLIHKNSHLVKLRDDLREIVALINRIQLV
jgi:CheY-like chemotaxis protein